MLNYMNSVNLGAFFTIEQACAFLGMSRDELRIKCKQYGVGLYRRDGQWGFPGENFHCLNNTLYFEQCRDGCDDSRIFVDICEGSAKTSQQSAPLGYIKNIKGLRPTYTFSEASKLLGISPDEIENICNANGLLAVANSDGIGIITCYGYLTLNNILCEKQYGTANKENTCV